MKASKMIVGLMLVAGAVSVANVAAKEPDTWQMGTLVGLDTRTTRTEGIGTQHYEQRETRNGKRVINGTSYELDQPKVTYVLTVRIGDMTYTAEHAKNLIFGYNPTDMVVNDTVTVSAAAALSPLTSPNTFGRSVAHSAPGASTVCRALPAYTGRMARGLPPSAFSSVISAASPHFAMAAARAMKSLPIGVALASTAAAPVAAACSDTMRAKPRSECERFRWKRVS